MRTKIKNEEISALSREILEKAGLPAGQAAIVTDSLLDAEIRGIETHGFIRLPAYIERIRGGFIAPDPEITISGAGCVLKVDGGYGLGQVTMREVIDKAMAVADRFGCAIAVIGNSNNFGAAGYFTRYAAEKGYIAYVTSNGGPVMVPFGGKKPMLGTDPFAVSFPAGKYKTFTLDVAVSAVAQGKIRVAEQTGKTIPTGWALDAFGKDTTDPVAALAGAMLPMAGHKGYGMAMIADMLCGLLSGAKVSCEAATMFDKAEKSGIGHFLCLMRVDAFLDAKAFTERVEGWFDRMKDTPKQDGVAEIFIPGEIENKLAETNDGTIEILTKTYEILKNLFCPGSA